MPTSTYVSLGTITLASTDSEIVFSSIPATYRDLILTLETIAGTAQDVRIRLNSDTGSNYAYVFMRGVPAGPETFATSTASNIFVTNSSVESGGKALAQLQLMDYSQTDKHTSGLLRSNYKNASSLFVEAYGVRWADTDAVNTITIYPSTGSFAVGSTFSLYGVN